MSLMDVLYAAFLYLAISLIFFGTPIFADTIAAAICKIKKE